MPQINSTTNQRALEHHGCTFLIPAMGTLLMPPHETLLQRQLGKKLFTKRPRSPTSPWHAHQPASTFPSSVTSLQSLFLGSPCRTGIRKQLWSGRPVEKLPSAVSWTNQAPLISSDTQVTLRLACPLAQIKLKDSRNEEALWLIPTTFPSQTTSMPSQIPPGTICSSRSSDVVGKTTWQKMRR